MEERRSTPGYIRQIHLELIAVLVTICVVLALYGWTLRPQSGGFPAVPENMAITVTDNGVSHVTETLNRTSGNGARLVLSQTIRQNSLQPTAHWTVEIDNIGSGRVCTPSSYVYDGSASYAYPLAHQRVTHPRVLASVNPGPLPSLTHIASSGFLYVWLCWSSDAPVNLDGSYLSAQFPALSAPYPKVLAVTRELTPRAGETADYAVQSRTQPTGSTSQVWVWSSGPGSADPFRFSAVDTSATQHDTYRAFLSGIVFGIAGGALVTVISELLAPISRRRDSRAPT